MCWGVLGIFFASSGLFWFCSYDTTPRYGFLSFGIEQPHLQQAAKESMVPLSSTVLTYEFVYSSDRLVNSISTVTIDILQFETSCSRKIDTEVQTHL